METSYFAAQTMQNKVRYSFDELPENVHKVSVHQHRAVSHAPVSYFITGSERFIDESLGTSL